MYKINDTVKLPLGEEGIIVNIRQYALSLWGFPYEVKITKSEFNEINKICQYKESELNKSNKE